MAAFPRKRLGWRLQLGILAALVSATAESACLAKIIKMCQKFMTEWRSVLLITCFKAAKGSWILVSWCVLPERWWHIGDILVTSNIRCDSGDWDSTAKGCIFLSPKGVLASAPWKQCHAYLMMEESQCLQSCPLDGLKFHNHIKYGLQKLIEIHQTTTNKLVTCTCTDIYRPILFPFRRNRTYLWFNTWRSLPRRLTTQTKFLWLGTRTRAISLSKKNIHRPREQIDSK